MKWITAVAALCFMYFIVSFFGDKSILSEVEKGEKNIFCGSIFFMGEKYFADSPHWSAKKRVFSVVELRHRNESMTFYLYPVIKSIKKINLYKVNDNLCLIYIRDKRNRNVFVDIASNKSS